MTKPPIASFQGEYRWLSNFWPCDIVVGDLTFGSTEAAYQAAKCAKKDLAKHFQHLSPGDAKRMGRGVTLRSDWEAVKLQVMEDLLRQKFSTPQMRGKLLATGDAELIEGNHWNDTFWGVCRGKGENNLGKLLMKIREDLRR